MKNKSWHIYHNVRIAVLIGMVALASAAEVAVAADVRDLGVPAGWKASDYANRGYDLLNKPDYENARRYLEAAIRTDPYLWTAHYNRATLFYQQKKWAAALQDLNTTIHLKPAFFDASFMRATVNTKLGNYNASLSDLNSLAALGSSVRNPITQGQALNERAWLRATCPAASIRNGGLAIADAKRACELSKWKISAWIDTLAAAYAEAGDFDSAVRYEEQAITSAGAEPAEMFRLATQLPYGGVSKSQAMELQKNVEKGVEVERQLYSKHLQLYKKHRPYREG